MARLSIPEIVKFKEEFLNVIDRYISNPIPGSYEESLVRRLMTYYERTRDIHNTTIRDQSGSEDNDDGRLSTDSFFGSDNTDDDEYSLTAKPIRVDRNTDSIFRAERHVLGIGSHTGLSDDSDDNLFGPNDGYSDVVPPLTKTDSWANYFNENLSEDTNDLWDYGMINDCRNIPVTATAPPVYDIDDSSVDPVDYSAFDTVSPTELKSIDTASPAELRPVSLDVLVRSQKSVYLSEDLNAEIEINL